MPKTVTGSGVWSLPVFSLSGGGQLPVPDPGPNTRGLTMTFDLRFLGEYSDEFKGERMSYINWKAEGFKSSMAPGAAAGQCNRFWKIKEHKIESLQHVDVDMYSYLSIDGGAGFGQDQLGLGIVTDKIKFFVLRNRTGGASLRVGGAPTAPWTSFLSGTMILQPGYAIVVCTQDSAAWGVVRGESQYLRCASTGGLCTLDIYIGGSYSG